MEQYDDLYYLGRLAAGYIKEDLTTQEIESLESWLDENPQNKERFRILTDEAKLQKDYSSFGSKNKTAAWARIVVETGYMKKSRGFAYKPYLVAASLLIGICFGGFFLLYHETPQKQVAQNKELDILPGSNQATLTLANGKKIIITKSLSGKIAIQGNTIVQADSTLAYTLSNKVSTRVEYNTLSTAKGEQSPLPLTLPDGSRVWLDAASSITFPTAFTDHNREVKITGEAYFEVVHNAVHPFKVSAKGQTIEDIGTHFNIKAYDDEPQMKTTVLEGSVSVFNSNHKLFLKPGEQAVIDQHDDIIKLRHDVDIKEVISWKNGFFRFQETGLFELMRDLSRWYNIDIVYKGDVRDELFYGTISRKLTLSQTLEILKSNDIHFKIGPKTTNSAGTLTITP